MTKYGGISDFINKIVAKFNPSLVKPLVYIDLCKMVVNTNTDISVKKTLPYMNEYNIFIIFFL